MIELALVVAAATLAAGVTAALLLVRLVPTIRWRVAGLALLAIALPLVAVLLSGAVMFHMGEDVVVLGVAAASSFACLFGAFLIIRSIDAPALRLADAARAFAAGDLHARAPETGPRELAAVGRAFNEMAADLERLFDARRELVAWASHDLRTPLASLRAMVEAVEDGVATSDEYLPAMRGQIVVLGRLVDDLFELAAIDAGALTVELREASVAELVAGCVQGVDAEARVRGVHLAATIGDDCPSVVCEPEKVERVLYNLLANALRHTPSDGSVAVSVAAAAGEVRVSVEDTGEGLPDDGPGHMFDRFWRADPARSSGGGAGLGLAIAKGLVEAQGGRIWAEQRPGGGARISFTLQAAPAAAA